jgi:cellulose biosynthesis protein BcsQ
VFAVAGVKGGVGATSLAVNAAMTLAKTATSGTLLVDFNVARGDAPYLGVEPRQTDALGASTSSMTHFEARHGPSRGSLAARNPAVLFAWTLRACAHCSTCLETPNTP